MISTHKPSLSSEIRSQADFSFIRYSVVWEDIHLLYKALSITPDDDVLSITSAGCNVLGLLLENPRSITALDMNPTQNALLELKMAAMRVMEYQDFIEFIGIRPSAMRLKRYYQIRHVLSIPARMYWDGHTDLIEQGVIYCGKLEKYFRVWQQEHLANIHPAEKIRHLLSLDDLEEQKAFFEEEWATPAFEQDFKNYFGTYNLQKGRDPALFKYVALDAGSYFYNRFKYVCTQLPAKGNYYLEFFLTSHYRDLNSIHPYLQESNYLLLRAGLDKVRLVTSDLESFLSATEQEMFSKANFSNLFEYMSEEHAACLLELLHPTFRKGGCIAYWNLMVPRSRPEYLAGKFASHRQLAKQLWQQDQSWFYRDFIVEKII
jgi:S-adenosylmethionine-diacylglycerol 3-amino-3-carboxypropyl transferase